MSLTYDEVETACFNLEKQGTKISTRNVREYVGSGSLTTISKYLQKRSEKNRPYVQRNCTAISRVTDSKRSKRTPVHHGVQESENQEVRHYRTNYQERSFKGWVIAAATFPVFAVCLALSFYFQVEAFSELVSAPTETIFGFPFSQISAGFLEAALVLLSLLGFLASTRNTRVMAWILFGTIGIGSGALMILNQERKQLSSVTPMEMLEDDQEIVLIRQAIARKNASWEMLSHQLDIKNQRSAAYKGESGNIRRVEKSMALLDSEMDVLRSEIKQITSDTRSRLSQRMSSPIEARVTFINEGIRIFLLFLTAFLVHVLLSCFGPLGGSESTRSINSLERL